MDESEANIARAVFSGDLTIADEVIKQEVLRYAVQRAILCPYSGVVLDVRTAVLIDGTAHGGKADIMHRDVYMLLMYKAGTREQLAAKLGYEFELLEGEKLFA